MKKIKNGFTLIELLAVIIIIGIIMLIAVPSVSNYISNSRKSTYINTIKEIMSSARNFVTKEKVDFSSTDVTYYVPLSCIDTENEKQSPYGEFVEDETFIIITYDGENYNYYWVGVDSTRHGIIEPTVEGDLDEKIIESDIEFGQIKTTDKIDGTTKVSILDKNNCKRFEGSTQEESMVINCLNPTYTGNLVTIAVCQNGRITQNQTGIEIGNYEVECFNATTGEIQTKECQIN